MGKAPMIRVSKLNAARKQLDCAIELWFADKDAVSIHSLAAAAHQIIHDINQKKGGGDLLFDSAVLKDEHRSKFISLLKKPMNFFKHANKDAEEIIEFPPLLSEAYMFFSIMGLQKIGETTNDTENTFSLWMTIHNPDWITKEYQKIMEERGLFQHLDEFKKISKGEFFETVMRGYAEIRYKGSF